MKINSKLILTVIFLLTLFFRLYISFTNSSFSNDDSYFNLRLTHHIINTKTPLTYDDLSYGGRKIIYPQVFNYFLAAFSFIPGYEKIIPALLSSLIVIIVYLISKKISENDIAALFAALFAAFIPIEIKTTINQISVYSLVIPIILLMILSILNLEKKKYFVLFIILSFLLPLIHPISILFLFSLIFYLILLNTESININKLKKEALSFSLFVIAIINFFLYKNALLRYGTNLIWQNIPSNLFSTYFQTFNILEALYLIGVLPLIFGVIGIYFGLFKKKESNIILLSSFILSTLLLMSLKLINMQIGILFISLPLVIASSKSLSNIYYYFSLTKFLKFKKYFNIILFVLTISLLVIPSVLLAISLPNYNPEIKVFSWFKDNTPENSVALVPFDLGNLLTYFGERKNVADDNFLLAPNVKERLDDIDLIYKSAFQFKRIELIKKYNINYVYFPDNLVEKYGVNKNQIKEDNCFKIIREDVYEFKC